MMIKSVLIRRIRVIRVLFTILHYLCFNILKRLTCLPDAAKP